LLTFPQHFDDPHILVLELFDTHAPSLDRLMVRLNVKAMTSQPVVVLVKGGINVLVVSHGSPM
jgi:hypothetical protein